MHDSNESSDNDSKRESTDHPNEEVDHELEKIRLKRMESLLRQQQQQKSQQQDTVLTLQDKIQLILQAIMTPEAFHYYLSIRDRDKSVAQRIEQIILPPSIMREIDLLIAYLYQGMIRSNIIDVVQIQQLERKILGIGPRITVKKRDGESTDLNSFLKNNKL